MCRDAVDPVPSPCVRLCCLDDNDICLGCFRNMAEILRWGEADNVEKRCILAKALDRKSMTR